MKIEIFCYYKFSDRIRTLNYLISLNFQDLYFLSSAITICPYIGRTQIRKKSVKCLDISYKTFGLTAQSINDVTSMDKSVRIQSDTTCRANR